MHASHLPGAGFAYFAVLAGVFVTAFYSFRLYFLVFHGKERFRHKPVPRRRTTHADEPWRTHDHVHEPHESPWVVTAAAGAAGDPVGRDRLLTIEPMLFGDFFKDSIVIDAAQHQAMAELAEEFHGAVAMALHGFTALPFWLALAGVVTAWYLYLVQPDAAGRDQARASARSTRCSRTSTASTGSTSVFAPRRARARQRPVEGRRRRRDRRRDGQRLGARGRLVSPAWCAWSSPATSTATRS